MAVQSLHKLDPEAPNTPKPAIPETAMHKSLERTSSRSGSGENTPKTNSLERNSHMARSEHSSPKMNSLERMRCSRGSLDKTGHFSPKMGSLDRKASTGSPRMNSLERNAHLANAGAFSPKLGSLERNAHISFLSAQIPYEPDLISNYHPQPTVYHFSPSQVIKETQPNEENIYDFGGADVKSCAYRQPYYMQKLATATQENKQQVRCLAWLEDLFARLCFFASQSF